MKNREVSTTKLPSPDIIEKVMMDGDLKNLTPDQRLAYYKSVCETLGLNPLTKPFDYITLDGKLVLYARADCAAQLRKRYNISIKITSRETHDTIYTAVAHAAMDNVGREDESIGAVSIMTKEGGQIKGMALANSVMKAETKAKRRVTLSICGLGMLDESEVEDHTDYDQRVPTEIIERNVRQATANARSETFQSPQAGDYDAATGGIITQVIPANSIDIDRNEWGPLVITEENYKQLKSHIGKAGGTLLGVEIGSMNEKVIDWLYDKWRAGLGPLMTDQEERLKKAVELARAARQTALESPIAPKPAAAAPTLSEASKAAIRDLRQRIEDLVITEEQAIGYMRKGGLELPDDAKTLEQLSESFLLFLSTPAGWNAFKDQVELDLKPKTTVAPVKKGRKK